MENPQPCFHFICQGKFSKFSHFPDNGDVEMALTNQFFDCGAQQGGADFVVVDDLNNEFHIG